MGQKIRVGALISGGGSNLQAIIDACESGKIDAALVFVGSDNPEAYGLNRAEKHGISTFKVDYGSIIQGVKAGAENVRTPEDFNLEGLLLKQSLFPIDTDPRKVKTFLTSRAIAESRLLEEMASHPFDLLVLAGFMRNLTPYFIDRVNTEPGRPRIMNIHPALLPSFPGVDGYGDTFRYGSKVGGCTVHFIDYGEDSGPIIGQRAFQIQPDDTIETIKEKGLKLEWELYPECIQLFAQGRLKLVQKSFSPGPRKEYRRTIVEIAPP